MFFLSYFTVEFCMIQSKSAKLIMQFGQVLWVTTPQQIRAILEFCGAQERHRITISRCPKVYQKPK